MCKHTSVRKRVYPLGKGRDGEGGSGGGGGRIRQTGKRANVRNPQKKRD